VAITYAALRGRDDWKKLVAYALIVGGATGNLVDRLHEGAVTDFVRWHIHDHMWPVFNVADAVLLVGVIFLIVAGSGTRRKIAV
jgi:signal peptidase II